MFAHPQKFRILMNAYRILKLVILLVVVVLAYALYRSVRDPVVEAEERALRRQAVIERLSKARDAQMAYRAIYGEFAASWDRLLRMARTDSFVVVKTIGDPDDTTQQVVYDTLKVAVRDSLFADFPIDSLPFVPGTSDTFLLQAGRIKVRGVFVNVFEVAEPPKLAVDPERPLQVGSMYEPNYSGNW